MITAIIKLSKLTFFCVYVGFWLKIDTYREQPDIHFKHEYLLIVETNKLEHPVICTTYAYFNQIMKDHNHCTMIKVLYQLYLITTWSALYTLYVLLSSLKTTSFAVKRRGHKQGWKVWWTVLRNSSSSTESSSTCSYALSYLRLQTLCMYRVIIFILFPHMKLWTQFNTLKGITVFNFPFPGLLYISHILSRKMVKVMCFTLNFVKTLHSL